MAGRQLNILIIGGSGFVSGAVARTAVAYGHRVWIVTRGEKPLPEGVQAITCDRKDRQAFAAAIAERGIEWDFAVDCIGYEADDARQDVEVLAPRVAHLVFISTDFVFDPPKRCFPQPFDNPFFLTDDSYGANKRRCEEVLLGAEVGGMLWTVFRPCHIYGPGSELGCLPLHARDRDLITRMRAGEPLKLIGGGSFLQQPIFVRDLADLILSARGNELANRGIYCSVGPDIVESRKYYEIIADVLGVPVSFEEVPVSEGLADEAISNSFLCHRIYDLSPLRLAGLKVPNTPIAAGLEEHVRSKLT